MQIKFPIFNGEEDLDIIQSSLDCRIFVPKDTLQKFLFQLRKIDLSLTENHEGKLQEVLTKKRELIESLNGRCLALKERNSVISFAEEAEHIANSSPILTDAEIESLSSSLLTRIDTFIADHKPTKNNMKFLRFAKKLLQKAKKHEPVLTPSTNKGKTIAFHEDSPQEISLDDFALAEGLYEIAAILFQGNVKEFKETLSKNFSFSSQKELTFHIHNCNGNLSQLDTKEAQERVIQGILGYAHTITDYFAGETPYPSKEEIKSTFTCQII
ncbi:hypothetical protein K0U07_00740 [bacterium]|nr:hypothetical protein [bacterium]